MRGLKSWKIRRGNRIVKYGYAHTNQGHAIARSLGFKRTSRKSNLYRKTYRVQ